MPTYETPRRELLNHRHKTTVPIPTDDEYLAPPVEAPAVLGPTEIPAEVLDWWDRLLHEPKINYAVACVDYQLGRADRPTPPENSEKWATKVEHKAATLCAPYAHGLFRADA